MPRFCRHGGYVRHMGGNAYIPKGKLRIIPLERSE